MLVLFRALNSALRRRLEPCDVLICMSGIYLEAAKHAREKYAAKIYMERGSRHIESQKAILDDLRDQGFLAGTVDTRVVERDLICYSIADKISVPSVQVERSFMENGISQQKLFRNPYGVDINMFPITQQPTPKSAVLLFVGLWTYRKGVDLLVESLKELGPKVRLIHVGPVADAPLPNFPNFEHHDAVPQWQLTEYYSKAHLFVLASREEGFALVLFQALASGLPIVATDRTGGEDLWPFLPDKSWVKIVPTDNLEALVGGIQKMLPRALALKGERDLLGLSRERLTWAAYAKRYSQDMEKLVQG